jgi:hypothetical protein
MFRDFANRHGDPEKVLASVKEFADIFQRFETFAQWSRERYFFERIEALQVTSAYPFLLAVFEAHEKNPTVLHPILDMLESFLIRRMICQLNTRGYNRLFIELLKAYKRDPERPVEAVQEFLLSSESESGRWPEDREFLGAWVDNPIYKLLTQQRTRMVLEALELGLRTDKSEKMQLDEKLTIEHIMPQNWQGHWPLDGADEQRRIRAIHSIGNLTLINKKLNPSISNGPWAAKRDGLAAHSLMRLNKELVKAETWNEDQIRARAEALCEVAKKVWARA